MLLEVTVDNIDQKLVSEKNYPLLYNFHIAPEINHYGYSFNPNLAQYVAK
jgi:hypothetical protein